MKRKEMSTQTQTQTQTHEVPPKTINNVIKRLEDTKLYKSTYELLTYVNICFENTPRNKVNIRNDMYNIAKLILVNVYKFVFEENKEAKLNYLNHASSQICILFVSARLACDAKIISKHQYSVLIPIIASIGENLDDIMEKIRD